MPLPSAALTVSDLQETYFYLGDDMFVCFAELPNTDPALAVWKIKKIFGYASDPSHQRWANADNRFNLIANDYATFDYDTG